MTDEENIREGVRDLVKMLEEGSRSVGVACETTKASEFSVDDEY